MADGDCQVIEHLLLPGVFIAAPTFLVILLAPYGELGRFGAYYCSLREVEDGICFRASLLLGVSMMSKHLVNCRAVVECGNVECWFGYDEEQLGFRQEKIYEARKTTET